MTASVLVRAVVGGVTSVHPVCGANRAVNEEGRR